MSFLEGNEIHRQRKGDEGMIGYYTALHDGTVQYFMTKCE